MNILCITDQPLFRDGLALLVGQAFERSTFVTADDCESALALLPAHPDLTVILVDRPRHHASTGRVAALREAAPGIPMVVLIEDEDRDVQYDAVELDVMRFIPKRAPSDVLIEVLRRGAGGSAHVMRPVARRSRLRFEPRALPVPHWFQPRLTLREEQVLSLLMRGMANKCIARQLGIACEGTVKQHVSAVLEKLDARNRTEAVMKAVDMGLAPHLRN